MNNITRALLTLPFLVAFGCADADARSGDDGTSRPDVSPRVVRAAEEALEDVPRPPAGHDVGVVLVENADGFGSDWAVLTRDGVTVLSLASNCSDDGDRIEERDLVWALDPGDLVTWSQAGADALVCSGELRVLEKLSAGR